MRIDSLTPLGRANNSVETANIYRAHSQCRCFREWRCECNEQTRRRKRATERRRYWLPAGVGSRSRLWYPGHSEDCRICFLDADCSRRQLLSWIDRVIEQNFQRGGIPQHNSTNAWCNRVVRKREELGAKRILQCHCRSVPRFSWVETLVVVVICNRAQPIRVC